MHNLNNALNAHLLLDLPVQLETDRLILRAPQFHDAENHTHAVIVRNIERLKNWFPWARDEKMLTVEENERFIRNKMADWILRDDFLFLMFDKANGAYIGNMGLHPRTWAVKRFEIGYWIDEGAEGQGLVSEAAKAVCDYAFTHFGANHLVIRALDHNKRSRAVPEKLGFTLEGVLRQTDMDVARGAPGDMAHYGLTRGEWLATQQKA